MRKRLTIFLLLSRKFLLNFIVFQSLFKTTKLQFIKFNFPIMAWGRGMRIRSWTTRHFLEFLTYLSPNRALSTMDLLPIDSLQGWLCSCSPWEGRGRWRGNGNSPLRSWRGIGRHGYPWSWESWNITRSYCTRCGGGLSRSVATTTNCSSQLFIQTLTIWS